MYLIDNTYFTGKYEISDVNESHTGVSELLDQFIDIEVRLFMQNLLGVDLFRRFDIYITPYISHPIELPHIYHPAILPDPNRIWEDLIFGVEYDGKKWNGLIYKIGPYPKSLFTNYIWCKYFLDKNKIDGNGNANVIDSKNAILGNAANQFFPIWNEFVTLTTDMSNKEYVSLNQFLQDKKDDYPGVNYVQADFANRFL